MSFPRYAKYKPSGVEWLGEVPENWNWLKFRYVYTESNEKIEGDVLGPMLSVSGYRGIEVKAYEDENQRRSDEDLVGYRIVRTGQLVVNTMWLNYAGLGVSEHEGHVSPAYRAYFIKDALDRGYAHHLMRSSVYVAAYTQLLTGVRPNSLQMSREDLMSFPVLVPPRVDQQAIAEFLDRETAKIDALVAEQERLIELLKEKRQAVISHAVTKGLNPNVPMKDSGIEWLGQVPAHWAVTKLRFLCDVQTGGRDTEHAVEDGKYPFFVRSQTVERIDSFSFDGEAVLTAGDGAGVGKVFHYFNGAFDFHQRVYMLSNFREISGRFIFHFLRENFYKVALEGGAKSTVDSLRRPMFLNFWTCVPPKPEQAQIVAAVEDAASRFDALAREAERAVELLQERRAALISAAVTGQIDVRPESLRSVA